MNNKIYFILVILIAVVLRLYGLEDKNLWFDEVYSWKLSQTNITEIIIATSGDIHPPFYYIVLNLWTGLFSDSIISLRILSALFGLLSMFFIYKLSERFLKNNLQVLLVLILYAVSPLNIFYSQEVRMLNLNLLLCLGSVYYFFLLKDKQNFKNGILFICYSVLAVYTHYFALLILFTQLIIVLLNYFSEGKNKKTLWCYVRYFFIILILYVPWIPVFLRQVSKGQPWRTEQTFLMVGKNLLDYFKDIFFSIYFTFESSALMLVASVFSIFIFLFLIYSVIKSLNDRTFFKNNNNLITYFFFIPFIISLIISYRHSLVLSRYLSIIIPYLFISIVYFSFGLFKSRVALTLSLIIILISSYGTYINFNNNFKNNDYRKVISYLEKNYTEGDEIIAEPHFMGWSIDYYIEHSNTEIKKPLVLGWDLNMQIDSLKKLNNLNNVWVILDYSALEKNNYDSLKNILQDLNYMQKKKKTFYVIPAKVNVEYYIR